MNTLHSPVLLILIVLVVAMLSACATATPAQELISGGGSSPEDVTESFFEDLNAALQDADLQDEETRRSWTERLASRFAPSERASRRSLLGQMLADFAFVRRNEAGERYQVEVLYDQVVLISRDHDRGRVRLIDGKIRITRYREDENGDQAILSERERPLSEVIGITGDAFPVIRVEQRWFLTE
jgi:hypothetical protein